MSGWSLAMFVAALPSADEKPFPSVSIDGHTLRIESISNGGAWQRQGGRAGRSVNFVFTVTPKDHAKSYAYELGQRFVAHDAAGKEIPLGRIQNAHRMTPTFRLAGYPSPPRAPDSFHNYEFMTFTLPVYKPDAAVIASLEGDLFVSDVELVEFTFAKNELTPNVLKKTGAAEAKLFLFDERPSGVDVGFKLKLPLRSRAEALLGDQRGFRSEQLLLFGTVDGRKTMVHTMGGSASGGGRLGIEDQFSRIDHEFHGVKLDRPPDALHLVVPIIEYPRRHVFRLKDIPIPADGPPQRLGRPNGGIALNQN